MSNKSNGERSDCQLLDLEILLSIHHLSGSVAEQIDKLLLHQGFSKTGHSWSMGNTFELVGSIENLSDLVFEKFKYDKSCAIHIDYSGKLLETFKTITLSLWLEDNVIGLSIYGKDFWDPNFRLDKHRFERLDGFAKLGEAIADVVQPVAAVFSLEEYYPEEITADAIAKDPKLARYPLHDPFSKAEILDFLQSLEKIG